MKNFVLFLLLHMWVIVNAQTCPEVSISNQTYSSNTTIGGCKVNLENMTIGNNATLTVNTENGVTISGEFNVNAGSLFETGFAQMSVPTLAATDPVTGYAGTRAVSGGNVISDGGSPVVEKGICWNTSQNPTTDNSHTVSSQVGIGSYSVIMTGLNPLTTYWVRAYATNAIGTSYGTPVSFTTPQPTAALTQAAITGGQTGVLIRYTVTLSSPAAGTKYFSVTHTNSTNTGTTIENITVNSGVGTGILDVVYEDQINSYNAICDFNGTQTGYTCTTSQLSFLIPALPKPTLAATTTASSITNTSAASGGNVTNDGGTPVTSRGICWATSQNPTTANSKVVCGSGTGSFTGNLTGLTAGTTYYIRSYATNSAGTAYGTQTSFTTSAPSLPVLVATGTAYSISYTSAYSTGDITSDGGSPVTNRGLCCSTSSNPTTSNSTCSAGSGTGSFTGNLTGLSPATTYYVRSFATNSVGTGYGSQTSFTTLTPQIPSLAATTAVTNISATTATSGGNVTSVNGSTITARGVCWSTSSNPTVANSKTVDGSGDGVFTSSITGLTASTLYYVRAYATNSVGTGYGTQTSFTTTASGITANITASFLTSGPTYYVVQWNVTLNSPALGNIVIPCVTTNATNSGTTTVNVSFSTGQTYSGANTVTYTRPIGTDFTAYCTFGTMPTGYIAGSNASYVIVKQ